jgi:hypothetical protein
LNVADPAGVDFAFPTMQRRTPAPFAAGLYISRDPKTGLPTTPSAAQRRAAAAAFESAEALTPPLGPLRAARAPGGGEIVHLQGQFQVYSIARRAADGRVLTDCSLDPASAKRLLDQRAPAESAWEEK